MVDRGPLSTREIASYCHVSPVTVWKWIKDGKLHASRLSSGHYRVDRPVLKAFLQRRGVPIDPEVFSEPTKRVLVIDDEPAVVEIVTRGLRQFVEGLQMATARDGFEAGLQVATFKPILLILDLMMPGIDGFQVCQLIRQNPATAHSKILIITAFGNHQNIQRALKAGADDYMHKPLDLARLKEKVLALLDDGS